MITFGNDQRPTAYDESVLDPTLGPEAYGEAFAGVYDEWYHDVTDAEATADFVAARAGTGPVIELGVGTGRLARPLQARGLAVIGVDASSAMLDRCALQIGVDSGAPPIHLIQADMTRLPLRPEATAALIAFNTLFNVTTVEGQRQVFRQLRAALGPDGVVIVEALDLGDLSDAPARSIGIRERRGDGLTVIATSVDPINQQVGGRHIDIDDRGISIRPWNLRWASADEIDQYASAAGFRLVERYRDWTLEAPAVGDDRHISVYRAERS